MFPTDCYLKVFEGIAERLADNPVVKSVGVECVCAYKADNKYTVAVKYRGVELPIWSGEQKGFVSDEDLSSVVTQRIYSADEGGIAKLNPIISIVELIYRTCRAYNACCEKVSNEDRFMSVVKPRLFVKVDSYSDYPINRIVLYGVLKRDMEDVMVPLFNTCITEVVQSNSADLLSLCINRKIEQLREWPKRIEEATHRGYYRKIGVTLVSKVGYKDQTVFPCTVRSGIPPKEISEQIPLIQSVRKGEEFELNFIAPEGIANEIDRLSWGVIADSVIETVRGAIRTLAFGNQNIMGGLIISLCDLFKKAGYESIAILIILRAEQQSQGCWFGTGIRGVKASIESREIGACKGESQSFTNYKLFVHMGFIEWCIPIVNASGLLKTEADFKRVLQEIFRYGPYLNVMMHAWAKKGFHIYSFFGSGKERALYFIIHEIGSIDHPNSMKKTFNFSDLDLLHPEKIDPRFIKKISLPERLGRDSLNVVLKEIKNTLRGFTNQHTSNSLQIFIMSIEDNEFLDKLEPLGAKVEWRVLGDNVIHLSVLDCGDRHRKKIEEMIRDVIIKMSSGGYGFWICSPESPVKPIFGCELNGLNLDKTMNFKLTFYDPKDNPKEIESSLNDLKNDDTFNSFTFL